LKLSLRLDWGKSGSGDCSDWHRRGVDASNVIGAQLANGDGDGALDWVLAAGKSGDGKNNGDTQDNQKYQLKRAFVRFCIHQPKYGTGED